MEKLKSLISNAAGIGFTGLAAGVVLGAAIGTGIGAAIGGAAIGIGAILGVGAGLLLAAPVAHALRGGASQEAPAAANDDDPDVNEHKEKTLKHHMAIEAQHHLPKPKTSLEERHP